MKLTIESTTRIVEVSSANGGFTIPARVWEGVTESGLPVQLLVARLAVEANKPQEEFQRELQVHREPQIEPQAFPLKMII